MPSTAQRLVDRGRAALKRGAWGEAKEAFREAIESEVTPEASEGLGWALYWTGDVEASLDERERAYRLYVERGDRTAAAQAAIGIAIGSHDSRGAAVTLGWLERARNLLRGVPVSAVHGWLAFYEGHGARLISDDPATARKLARKAARIAVRCGEPQLELLSRALEGLALVNDGRVSDGMRRVDEATAAAMSGEMTDIESVAQTCCMLLYACERVRDYRRAAEWQQRIADFCRRWQVEPLLAACSTQRAAMLSGSGQWADAEAELNDALQRAGEQRLPLPDALVQMAELRRRQGKYDEALTLIAECETRTEAVLTRAAIALDSGDPVTAVELASRLLERKMGEKWVERAVALHLVAAGSLQLRDDARAADACSRLATIAARVRTAMVAGIDRMAAGELAAFDGRPEDARAAFVDAFASFDAAQAPFEAAAARLALARTLASLGRPTAAVHEIDAAIATFTKLGAAHELKKAAVVRQNIAVSVAGAAQPLTVREREVLHLIAEGFGDKQLATRLSLSEHTVHRHVSNIMRKLGVGSRSAAVALAVRSGWL